jgi:hypothetical protein
MYKIDSVEVYNLLPALLNTFSSINECQYLIVNGETPMDGFHCNKITGVV